MQHGKSLNQINNNYRLNNWNMNDTSLVGNAIATKQLRIEQNKTYKYNLNNDHSSMIEDER